MKRITLIALVVTVSLVLTLAAIQIAFVNPTPNVGWNSWIPQYLDLASSHAESVCWSPGVILQPNVGWNS